MNDLKNSSNGLLVLRFKEDLSCETIQAMTDLITPTADALGVEPLVLGSGADARLEYGSSALLERVCVALERLVAQGEPPQLGDANVADTAPQALNARPSSRNSRESIGEEWPGEDSPLPPGSIFPLTPDMRVGHSCRCSAPVETRYGWCDKCDAVIRHG